VLLVTPDFIIEEFLKHQNLILKKTFRSREDFVQVMHAVKEIIVVVPAEEYLSFFDAAKAVSPDENDVLYFALALRLGCPI